MIGINTLKLEKKNVSGIGFAISASDLLTVLLKYFPDPNHAGKELLSSPDASPNTKSSPVQTFGTIELREPKAAEIYIDGKFVGDIPATLPLAAGQTYLITVRAPGHADWFKRISVLPGMYTVLDPWPQPE